MIKAFRLVRKRPELSAEQFRWKGLLHHGSLAREQRTTDASSRWSAVHSSPRVTGDPSSSAVIRPSRSPATA